MVTTAHPPGRRARVTISDVADALGLTKGTVSRALSDYPDIAEGTRARVRRQADRMGYRPLSHAQAIRTGRARAIGLILQVTEHDAHGPFLTDFLAGATQAASEEDWTLSVATAMADDDMVRVLDRLVSEHKADGFILQRTKRDDIRIKALQAAGAPFVMYGRTGFGTPLAEAPLSYYDIDGAAAMARGVDILADLGHRRIAFVGSGIEYNFTHVRHAGFVAGMAARGLDVDPDLVLFGGRLSTDGARLTEALLDLPAPPTAIVFAVDEAALGAWAVARDRGIEIGRDLSIIGYDNSPAGRYAQPGLSTFGVDTRTAGRRLAKLLIRQCRGEDPGTMQELAQATWEPRGSHGPLNGTP